jgi:hypothetical protein
VEDVTGFEAGLEASFTAGMAASAGAGEVVFSEPVPARLESTYALREGERAKIGRQNSTA